MKHTRYPASNKLRRVLPLYPLSHIEIVVNSVVATLQASTSPGPRCHERSRRHPLSGRRAPSRSFEATSSVSGYEYSRYQFTHLDKCFV
jgi:hypothetical protein